MIIPFVAAMLLDSTTASSTSTQPAAPMREIVYKFSENLTNEFTTDQAPNDSMNAGGSSETSGTGLAAPPESSRRTSGFNGTMTIDVLEVDADGYLKADVKEATDAENGTKPFEAVFIVRPDGNLVKVSGTEDDGMTSLMSYFGTQYFADHDLMQGAQWTTDMTYGKVEYQTSSSVTASSGTDATIKSTAKAVKGLGNGSLTVQTSLVYRASKLVPLTLDVLQIRSGSGDTASSEQTSHFHFDRVSDTLDKS